MLAITGANGGGPRSPTLAKFRIAVNNMAFGLRRVGEFRNVVVRKVAFASGTTLKRCFAKERGGESENYTAFDLRNHIVGMDSQASIDHADYLVVLESPGIDSNLSNLSNDPIERSMYGAARAVYSPNG